MATVFFAAWLGGLGPALVATGATIGVALLLPVYSLALAPAAPVGMALFALLGVATGWLGESRLRAQSRAEAAANEARAAAIRAEEAAVRAQHKAVHAEMSEQRYRAFIEQTAEGVWRIELEQPVSVLLPEDEQIDHFYAHGFLAECNDAMAHMYGFERAEQLVGARLGDLTPRSDPNNLAFLHSFIRSGYRLSDAQSHERDREGKERYFLNNFIGIVSDGHLLRAWGSQRDVTLSRQAERVIQASEARFRSVFESGMLGIGFWNGERMTEANDALLSILGYTRVDLRQGLLRHGRLTPEGYEAADRRATEEVAATGSCVPYEKEFLRNDGTRVLVLVGGARLGTDLSDAVFFVLDLTEQRRAEERVRQAERMEVVGQLAGGMAHEANNQMSVVLGATSFILGRSDITSAVRQDVEYIQRAAERTASITRQLLAFSRRQVLKTQVVDLNAVLEQLEPLLRRTLTEQQTLLLQREEGVIPIRADPVQLDQVLLNLAINARDAMSNGGTLTVETRTVELTEDYVAQRRGVTIVPGRYAALVVSDTGHGMDKQTMKRLFEPFFTTKEVGKGSGLPPPSLRRRSSGRRRVDAVLTDLAMPELGGRQLAQRLREEWPDLPVVFMSGYTDDDVARRGLLDAGVAFLEKPISPEVLTGKIRQLLAAGARKTEQEGRR